MRVGARTNALSFTMTLDSMTLFGRLGKSSGRGDCCTPPCISFIMNGAAELCVDPLDASDSMLRCDITEAVSSRCPRPASPSRGRSLILLLSSSLFDLNSNGVPTFDFVFVFVFVFVYVLCFCWTVARPLPFTFSLLPALCFFLFPLALPNKPSTCKQRGGKQEYATFAEIAQASSSSNARRRRRVEDGAKMMKEVNVSTAAAFR